MTIEGDGDCKIGDVEVDELVFNTTGTCTITGNVTVRNSIYPGPGTVTINPGVSVKGNPGASVKEEPKLSEFDRIVKEETDKLRRFA